MILSYQYKKNPCIKEIELEIAKGVDKIEHKSDEIIYHRDVNEECFDENISYDEGSYFLNTFIEFLEKKDEI